MNKTSARILKEIYLRLFRAFGPQHWWPADTPFEVMVGAILTQNTNWGNVEKAIANLKSQGLLSASALHQLPESDLAALIKPAGYFNIKARRLKNFLDFFFREYNGEAARMAEETTVRLRQKLLDVNGIGPETADSILLYAFQRPVFVIDAYTKRFLFRHNVISSPREDYHAVQDIFAAHLSSLKKNRKDAALFNEYHALIVRLGKNFCRPTPRCGQCPLNQCQYSLVHKCAHCHRALLNPRDRVKWTAPQGSGWVCRKCFQR